jgi:hypothetical protein
MIEKNGEQSKQKDSFVGDGRDVKLIHSFFTFARLRFGRSFLHSME